MSYFLGMTICKLFAAKLLNTPWLLHLDVFRPALNPVLSGRSRPDLVGREHGTTRWHAFECKGRISPPDATAKTKAKAQAERLVSVLDTACSLHVGAITYLRGNILQFYWRDPAAEKEKGINVPYSGDAWKHYYGPVLDVIKAADTGALLSSQAALVAVEGADLKVGAHPAIAKLLGDGKWERARDAAIEAQAEIINSGYQPDGLRIVAGQSWRMRFAEPDIDEGR